MNLVRFVVGNPGLKLLALILAWLLWYIAREDLREEATREVAVLVEIDPDSSIAATLDRQRPVTVKAVGPRRAVDQFRAIPAPHLVAKVRAVDVPAGEYEARRDFSKDDLVFPRSLGAGELRIESMDPPLVPVRLYRVAVQEKPVKPPKFEGATGLNVTTQMKSYDSKVDVRGRVGTLTSLKEIVTFVGEDQLRHHVEGMGDLPRSLVTFRLEIAPEQAGLFELVGRRELFATVELSRLAEREIEVPLALYEEGSPRPGTAPPRRRLVFAEINKPHFVAGEPPRVRLRLTGVPNALDALTPASLRAFALESDLPDDQLFGDVPIHVADLPPGVALSTKYAVSVEESR